LDSAGITAHPTAFNPENGDKLSFKPLLCIYYAARSQNSEDYEYNLNNLKRKKLKNFNIRVEEVSGKAVMQTQIRQPR
jgi:hypothetical protein